MSRRQRLQQAQSCEARALYLHARCNAGIARLRMRLQRRHHGVWLLGGGFGAGLVAARIPVRRLWRVAGSAMRIIGILRVPLGALFVGSQLVHESRRADSAVDQGEA